MNVKHKTISLLGQGTFVVEKISWVSQFQEGVNLTGIGTYVWPHFSIICDSQKFKIMGTDEETVKEAHSSLLQILG